MISSIDVIICIYVVCPFRERRGDGVLLQTRNDNLSLSIHIYIYMYRCIYIYTYMYPYYVCIYIYIHMYMCIHMCIYIYIYTHLSSSLSMCIYIYKYINIFREREREREREIYTIHICMFLVRAHSTLSMHDCSGASAVPPLKRCDGRVSCTQPHLCHLLAGRCLNEGHGEDLQPCLGSGQMDVFMGIVQEVINLSHSGQPMKAMKTMKADKAMKADQAMKTRKEYI